MSLVSDVRRRLLAAVAAILPIVALGIFKLLVMPRPFWVYYYDPENIYFYQGLLILRGVVPSNIDNPGTPLQLLSSLIATFTGSSILDLGAFLDVARPLAFIAQVGAAILLLATVLRAAPPLLQVSAIWAYFASPIALEFSHVWSPEAWYFPLGALVLASLHWYFEKPGWKRVILPGLVLGVCVATKVLLLAWAGGAVVAVATARRWRDAAVCLAAMLLGFLVSTIPIASEWWTFVTRLTTLHTLNSHDQTLLTVLLRTAPWLLVICAAILYVVFHRISILSPFVVFGGVALFLCYAAGSSNPAARYFYPSALAVTALLASVRQTARHGPTLILTLMVGAVLSYAMLTDVVRHRRHVRGAEVTRAALDRMIPPGSVVVYGFRVPAEAIALAANSKGTEDAVIATKYPDGTFTPWRPEVVLPPGVIHWDYLVISPQHLERFPEPVGERIGRAGRFLVYAAP